MIHTILFGLLTILLSAGFSVCIFFLLTVLSRNKKVKFRPSLFSGNDWSFRDEQEPDIPQNNEYRAFVKCNSKKKLLGREYTYTGFKNCAMQKNSYASESGCSWGCIGFGSCAVVCPQNAITIENGTAVVSAACIGCGKCIEECPNKLISLIPACADYVVACAAVGSEEMKNVCDTACIGCAECAHIGFPEGFYVRDGQVFIDYNRSGDRSYAASHCSSACIVKFQPEEKKSFKMWKFYSTLIAGGKDGE